MLSFVVPAHNEAELLGRTLTALVAAARAAGEPWEIIVVNDDSTDRTAEIGAEHEARVLTVHYRRIAATRNAGARAAIGDILFFIDADTVVTPQAVRAAVRVLRHGAVGGGCVPRFDGPVPFYAAVLERAVLPFLLPLLKMAAGCFLFCSAAAYAAAGGFDERLFWSEEVAFGNRLKRLGRFVILRERVATSGRKMRTHSLAGLMRVAVRLALGRPSALEYWYGRRDEPPRDPV
jgi:glycosyltransferase involved in cell wall biosynthesis